jgi:GTP-binding protein HflX
VDISAPAAAENTARVREVLAEIDAAEIPQILVMNKVDRVPAGAAGDTETIARRLLSGPPEHPNTRAVGISALTGEGIDRLLETIDEVLPLDPIVRTVLHLAPGDGATLAMLHEFGRVLSTRYTEEGSEIEAEIPQSLERRLASKD